MTAMQEPVRGSFVPEWTFSDRLRKVRRDIAQESQEDFAAHLGVTKVAYAAWESGRNVPRGQITIAKRVEVLTGVPASWLLGLDEPDTPSRGQIKGDIMRS
jgi:transcriptional regulator with XRE-family HTH domain